MTDIMTAALITQLSASKPKDVPPVSEESAEKTNTTDSLFLLMAAFIGLTATGR